MSQPMKSSSDNTKLTYEFKRGLRIRRLALKLYSVDAGISKTSEKNKETLNYRYRN